MRNLLFLAAIVALTLTGCFLKRHREPNTQSTGGAYTSITNAAGQNVILTLEGGLHGTVSSANQNLKFVVLSFPLGQMPAANQHLYVYRRGLRVGELDVTGPQNDESTVADIIAGEAQTGDEVRDK